MGICSHHSTNMKLGTSWPPSLYSNLAPFYFHLFWPQKQATRSRQFANDNEVNEIVHAWLALHTSKKAFKSFVDQWATFTDKQRDYVEKYYICNIWKTKMYAEESVATFLIHCPTEFFNSLRNIWIVTTYFEIKIGALIMRDVLFCEIMQHIVSWQFFTSVSGQPTCPFWKRLIGCPENVCKEVPLNTA